MRMFTETAAFSPSTVVDLSTSSSMEAPVSVLMLICAVPARARAASPPAPGSAPQMGALPPPGACAGPAPAKAPSPELPAAGSKGPWSGARAATLAAPAFAQPAGSRVLRYIPQADVTVLDPVVTTAYITRHHALMVWDQLYGLDSQLRPQPQMVAGHTVEDGNRLWTFTLRDGLRFHDGEPVRAVDCVASLKRWMKRNSNGQKLEPLVSELTALDDRRLRFRLTRAFPRLLPSLASPSNPAAFIMPERIAATDPFQQIRETVGSGTRTTRQASAYTDLSFHAAAVKLADATQSQARDDER